MVKMRSTTFKTFINQGGGGPFKLAHAKACGPLFPFWQKCPTSPLLLPLFSPLTVITMITVMITMNSVMITRITVMLLHSRSQSNEIYNKQNHNSFTA